MDEQEQRALAHRLAENSNVLDFKDALRIVQFDSAEARKLLREKRERKRLLEELARANERLHRAALEFR
jgi:hypothetical protein